MNESAPGLIVLGAGRMGRLVYEQAPEAGFDVRAVVSPTRPGWCEPAAWREQLDAAPDGAGLVVDFSRAEGTLDAAEWCADNGVALVSGTTGLDAQHHDALRRAGKVVPVLWAANFSVGMQVCLALAARAAASLDPGVPVRITDVHHVYKKDAPSGTALTLGEAVQPLTVTYDSIREDEVVGIHEVRFELAGESIGILHQASDRGIYARGALRAGHWLLAQAPGLYHARDWIAAEEGD